MAKNKKGRVIGINMEGIEAHTVAPEGDHTVTVKEVELKVSEASKQYLAWQFEVAGGGKLWHNTSLQPQALFNLKNVLVSLGVPVPNKLMNLDLDELIGLKCGVTVAHEMYEGKKKARITDFFPSEDAEADDGDEIDEEEGPDVDTMNLQELLAFASENDIAISKKIREDINKVRKVVQEALDAEDEDDL